MGNHSVVDVESRGGRASKNRTWRRLAALTAILILSGFSFGPFAAEPDTTLIKVEAEWSRRLDDYVPIMKMNDAYIDSNRSIDAGTARILAAGWNEGIRTGQLKPITSIPGGKDVELNLVHQAVQANMVVGRSLLESSQFQCKHGQWATGAYDAMLGILCLRALAESDAPTHLCFNLQMRRGLGQIQRAWPHLNEKDRTKIRSGLEGLKSRTTFVADMGFAYHRLSGYKLTSEQLMRVLKEDGPMLKILGELRNSKSDSPLRALEAAREQVSRLSDDEDKTGLADYVQGILVVEIATQRMLARLTDSNSPSARI